MQHVTYNCCFKKSLCALCIGLKVSSSLANESGLFCFIGFSHWMESVGNHRYISLYILDILLIIVIIIMLGRTWCSLVSFVSVES